MGARSIAKSVMIGALDVAGRVHHAGGIPILCYHSIDDSGSPLSVPPKQFRAQMEFLTRQGYQTIALHHLCNLLARGEELPTKAVVLTFDDGYRNNYTQALPVLLEHDFCATLFLATGYVGKRIGWVRTDDIPELEMATWEEVRQMSQCGFDIGAHSVTHPNLCRLPTEEVHREVAGSKEEIEQRLGQPATLFAYPYGEFDPRVKAVVDEVGFVGAVTLVEGRVQPGEEFTCLKRVNVTGISRVGEAVRMAFFRCCVTGTVGLYSGLKSQFPTLVHGKSPWK